MLIQTCVSLDVGLLSHSTYLRLMLLPILAVMFGLIQLYRRRGDEYGGIRAAAGFCVACGSLIVLAVADIGLFWLKESTGRMFPWRLLWPALFPWAVLTLAAGLAMLGISAARTRAGPRALAGFPILLSFLFAVPFIAGDAAFAVAWPVIGLFWALWGWSLHKSEEPAADLRRLR